MLDLVQYVDHTYCINLDSRKDRWEEASSRFEELGIASYVERISAVIDDDPRQGCRKSHIKIVTNAQNNQCENILIFEDDVLFLHDNEPDFSEILRCLENNKSWELFYLGGSPVYPASRKNGSVFKCRFYHTHAYIINRRAYEKALNCGLPIDVWYSLNMISYGFFPLYAVQGPSRSDIQNRELTHLKDSMLRRFEKLVTPPYPVRLWNYLYLHYLYKYF